MKNKKFLMSILSVCLLASCAFGVACGGDEDESSSSNVTSSVEETSSADGSQKESKVKVSLNEALLTMQVYDKFVLTATVEESEGAVLWTTSDASVVTVDGGNLYAKKEGTATITATVEGVSATCSVTVVAPTTAPVLSFADNVRLNAKEKFEAKITATWKGEEIPEDVTYSTDLVGAGGIAGISIDDEKGTFTVTGIKAGTTTYRIYTTIRGVYVSKDVNITVYGTDNSIVANNVAFRPEQGFYSVDVATTNIENYVDNTTLDFSVYIGGKEVSGAELTWKTDAADYDSSIAVVEGDVLRAVGAGKTTLVGVYEKDGEELASVVLKINAYKPQITLQNESRKTLEVGDLQAFEVESELIGTIEGATFHGEDVFASVSDKTVMLDATKLPKEHELLGEQYLQVVTDKVIYDVPVMMYTLIINTAEELDRMGELSVYLNASGKSTGKHDGYFILGDNISYNKEFIPFLTQEQIYTSNGNKVSYDYVQFGWRAIFDGNGYNIDGLEIGSGKAGSAFAEASMVAEGGVFGVIHRDGVVKNVSFTNAGVHENTGFIAIGGGGLIENVYVSYAKFGIGTANWVATSATSNTPRTMGTFYSARASETAEVRNCVVDLATAKIVEDPNEKTYAGPSMRAAGVSSVMNGVIVICPNKNVNEDAGANFVYTSYDEFSDDITANSVFEEWDQTYWTRVNGIPMMKEYAALIDYDAPVSIDANATAFVGIENKIVTQGFYTKVEFVGEHVGASYDAGVLTVTEEAVGATVTLKISTYLNDTTDTVTLTVKKLAEEVTAIPGMQTVNLDVQVDNATKEVSPGAGYVELDISAVEGNVEIVLMDGKTVDCAVDGSNLLLSKAALGLTYGEKTLTLITADAVYEMKAFLITKVIMNKTDLDNFGYIAKEVRVDNEKMWGGYFQLGADIEYNAKWTTFIAGGPGNASSPTQTGAGLGWRFSAGGFEGIFDGNGHKIIGMEISNWAYSTTHAFIGVLKGGTIKDVAFVNTTNAGNGSVVTLGGEGTIENVYVQYAKFTAGENEGPGTFFTMSSKDSSANLTMKNCFVDMSSATLANTHRIIGVIGTLAKYTDATHTASQSGDFSGSMTNVYAVGDTKGYGAFFDPQENIDATEKGNTTVYESVEAFEAAYATDETLKATYDALVELFGLDA